jgi:hypothetical protein
VVDDQVDFGILNEELQRKVIRHLAATPNDRARLPRLDTASKASLIEHNRSIVQARYSLEAYGDRLLRLYQELAAVEPGPLSFANADELLDEFLQPHRFNLLRSRS